jgi:hypothetical protein
LIASKAPEEGNASSRRLRVCSGYWAGVVTVLERHCESKGMKVNGMKSQKFFEVRPETGDEFLKREREGSGVGRY